MFNSLIIKLKGNELQIKCAFGRTEAAFESAVPGVLLAGGAV